MKDFSTKYQALAPYFLSILRICAAMLFILPGTMKLFGFPVAMPNGAPAFMSQIWVGGVLEVFGGFLLLIGFCTRPIAFILAGEMAVAYFQFHYPQSFWPTINMGTGAALFSFIWLYISAAGPGPWSVDAMRK